MGMAGAYKPDFTVEEVGKKIYEAWETMGKPHGAFSVFEDMVVTIHRACRSCKGQGEVPLVYPVKQKCFTCNGTGVDPMKEKDKE